MIFLLNCFDKDFLEELPNKLEDIYQKLPPLEKEDKKFCDVILHLRKLVKDWTKNKEQLN